MSDYEKESELVAYCGIYCRLCDYFTGRIRDSARDLLGIVKKHGELKLFADTAKAFDFENFVKGLEWVSKEISPCVGGCRGGGGWRDCPMRKCCIERGIRFCYECNDFPCETLKFPKRVDELNEIKKMGLESWIKQKLEQDPI
ncbi:DUF3795 domain-containing protein [Candidatus Bathyarchaeota archaeon]|nr:DUF3795 domain-containing protein [Candidatus Bathyarchaeota archaeon]